MGYFTFTLADRKKETSLGYATLAYVACPDGNFICENYYDGYGRFGGRDIYELVAEWNKEHLPEIINKLKEINGDNYWVCMYEELILLYAEKSKEEVSKYAEEHFNNDEWRKKEWLREIGIVIGGVHNGLLPFPIKITKTDKIPYNQLKASSTTQ